MFSTLVPLLLAASAHPSFPSLPSSAEVQVGPSGQLATASGILSPPLQGDLVPAARQFVWVRRAQLGLPPGATLGEETSFGTRFGGSIHFPQQLDGLELYGAKVIVTVDNQRRVIRLASSVVPYREVSRAWRVTPEQALQRAAEQLEGALLRPNGVPYGGTKRMFFPVGETARAGYLVHVPTVHQLENWYLAVDAGDGSILWRQNRVHFGDEAHVYTPSPGGLSAGVGITPPTPVVLNHLVPNRDGGYLEGDQLQVFNCCPNANCESGPTATTKRSTGKMQTFQGVIDYDFAICDRGPRASNDPAKNPAGNYVFTPVDPPKNSVPAQDDPADSDLFAEVHAFYHVNNAYDFIRELSQGGSTGLPTFQMRDEKKGKKPTVWTNALMPDTGAAAPNAQGVYVSNRLTRQDNAAFLPVEAFDSLFVPEYKHDTDMLLIYQGDKADFAYDGPVLWHEFVHGVIYSTANFQSAVVFDARSANEEAAALHEGVADYFSAAFGQKPEIGTYVGPRTGTRPYIRTLQNDYACPGVLWGESHQDSQHFAGALWEARQNHFQGADQGRTFDAAVYAALVSMTPNTSFEGAAKIISAQVGSTFASMAGAQGVMDSVFTTRGVLGCSKVLDLTGNNLPREYYRILGNAEIGLTSGTPVPGPFQMMFSLPKGAKRLKVTSSNYFGNQVRVQLVARTGAPLTFTRNGSSVSHDAQFTVTPSVSSQVMTGVAEVNAPCGEELYFTLVNTSSRGRTLYNLQFSVEPQESCEQPGGGMDAGTTVTTEPPVTLLSVSDDGSISGSVPSGCGCGASAGGTLALWALLGLCLRRRRS